MLASEPLFESFCKWNVFCCKQHNHFHSFFNGPISVRIVQLVVKAQLLLCLPHLSISLSFCFSFEKRPTICSKMLLTWQEFDLIWFFIFLFFIWRRKRIWFSTRLDTTTSVCVLAFFFFFLRRAFHVIMHCSMSLVHCLRDPQTSFSVKLSLQMGLTALFTYLKNILLQCFKFVVFSRISDIQTQL